jgi:hypothetical protein
LDKAYTSEEKKCSSFVLRRRQLLHQCFAILREEFLELGENAITIPDPYGYASCTIRAYVCLFRTGSEQNCRIFLAGIINDFPEACRTCQTYSGQCKQPCFICKCPYDLMDRADMPPASWDLRTAVDSEARLTVRSDPSLIVHDVVPTVHDLWCAGVYQFDASKRGEEDEWRRPKRK